MTVSRYITILPSMHLSSVITPDEAISMRHPQEQRAEADTTPDTQPGFTPHIPPSLNITVIMQRLMLYPQSTVDWVVTILLLMAHFTLLTYILVALYRCLCSRNYAKWRSSWGKSGRSSRHKNKSPYYKQIRESVPLVLNGHMQVGVAMAKKLQVT